MRQPNSFSWKLEVRLLPAGMGENCHHVQKFPCAQSRSPVSWVSTVGRVERSVMRREVLLKAILAFSL